MGTLNVSDSTVKTLQVFRIPYSNDNRNPGTTLDKEKLLEDGGSALTIAVRVARGLTHGVTLFAGTSLLLMNVEREISGGKDLLLKFFGATADKLGHPPNLGDGVIQH